MGLFSAAESALAHGIGASELAGFDKLSANGLCPSLDRLYIYVQYQSIYLSM